VSIAAEVELCKLRLTLIKVENSTLPYIIDVLPESEHFPVLLELKQ
jgi:hypothetical protein